MKKLLNTLYVTSENSYLGLDGENIVVFEDNKEKGRLPLHNLEGIVSFGYRGVSPALMGGCAERNISLCFMTPQGRREEMCFYENSSMRVAWIQWSAWKLQKTVFLERCIMRDGFWNVASEIMRCRLMQKK